MNFLSKNCKSFEDREYVSALIVRMLPKLETLDLSAINQMLDYLGQALTHFNSQSSTKASDAQDHKSVTSDYVELRLRKANLNEMLQENEVVADIELDTSSIVNSIESLSELKQRLQHSRAKLATYNAYKR